MKMKKIKYTNKYWPGNTVTVTVGENVVIDPEATILREVTIGRGTQIDASSKIYGGVKIGEDCWIKRGAVLMNGVELGKNVTVGIRASLGDDAVVGDGASIADGVFLQERVRLGDDVRIKTPGIRFGAGVKIMATDQYIAIPPSAIPWLITVTPTLTMIGCQTYTRAELLAFTREQGENLGLTTESYDRLAVLLPALFAIIPEQKRRRR